LKDYNGVLRSAQRMSSPWLKVGLHFVAVIIIIYYTSHLLQYTPMETTEVLLVAPREALLQNYNPPISRMARISAALRSHVQYWNAQTEGMRYHLADAMSPWSKSCHCYAPWLNATSEDMCREIIEDAGT
jgi:hypothetical protein